MRNLTLNLNVFSLLLAFFVLFPINCEAQAPDKEIAFSYMEWRPIVYQDQGTSKGLYIEILKELFEVELGLELSYRERPWKRAQIEVEEGKSDLLITIPTEKRRNYALITEQPIFPLYFGIYSYVGHPKLDQIGMIETIQDIVDLDLVSVTNLGNGWHKENVEDKGVATILVPRDQSIAQVLSLKRGDIMIEPLVSMNYLIKKNNLTDKLVLTEARFGPINFHVLLSRNSKHRDKMPDINQALNRMITDGRLQQLLDGYSNLTD
jgi:polar amino acid transport system substrate-binding protein